MIIVPFFPFRSRAMVYYCVFQHNKDAVRPLFRQEKRRVREKLVYRTVHLSDNYLLMNP